MNPIRRYCVLVVAILLHPLTGRAQATKEWILGSWKSNRELTVAAIKLEKEVSPELRARLDNLFGRMTITYTDSEMSAFTPAHGKWPDWHFTSPYKILAATDSKLVIRGQNPRTKKDEDTTITFEGPGRYWISLGRIPGREYFDRVPRQALAP